MHSLNYLTKGRVFIIMVFLFCCFGVAENNNRTALKKPATKGALIIKGFYLGMSGDECANLINAKYFKILFPSGRFEGWRCCRRSTSTNDSPNDCSKEFDETGFPTPDNIEDSSASYGCERMLHYFWKKTFYSMKDRKLIIEDNFWNRVDFTFDSTNRLISFHFSPTIVGDLFNVSDLTAADFVQFFINSYKIPEMKVEYRSNLFGEESEWYYTSPNGWKLKIRTDKSIYIEYVPKETERKFD